MARLIIWVPAVQSAWVYNNLLTSGTIYIQNKGSGPKGPLPLFWVHLFFPGQPCYNWSISACRYDTGVLPVTLRNDL